MPARPRRRRPAEHYVYLFRDDAGKCRYVGYGKDVSRATAHLAGTSNARFGRFLERNRHAIEYAGPFFTERIGRAVESALISAINPDFNRVQGSAKWRFRPLGVPPSFAERLAEEPLSRAGLTRKCNEDRPNPALIVYISPDRFADGRRGYNFAHPPTDRQILKRMDRYWRLGSHVAQWRRNPETSPGILIAVAGRPSARIIIGAVKIDRNGWSPASDGYHVVPTIDPGNLDALCLRGLRIHPDANIKFGSITPMFFRLLSSSGRLL